MQSVIVHDWLASAIGGGEKSLEAIHRLFPSPILTLVKNQKKLEGSYFQDLNIQTSWIQKLPRAETKYRSYLPLFPFAIEHFDLRAYDLILSSSHCVAKGVIVNPDQLHICYCYTPMRYAWDMMYDYLAESGLNRGVKGLIARWFLHYLRGWDVHSSHRVDHYIAISKYVAKRIKKFYGRDAAVIYPPADLSFFQMREKKEDFYLTASRFVPYKKIPLIVEAFSQMPDKKLIVIGDGPEEKKVKEKAGKNIELLGFQSDPVLKEYLSKAKGFVFGALEDYGILPVEAMASGTPVIGFGKGAVCETVLDNQTGVLFHQQSAGSIIEAVQKFEKKEWDPYVCRKRAEEFSSERFNSEYENFVLGKYREFQHRQNTA